jgi:hypothetical protein
VSPGTLHAARARLGALGREAFSYLSVAGLAPRPDRPPGLSAVVRVRDEETWLEVSLRSVATVADEILVGDNGSRDRTPEILARLAAELGGRLAVLRCPELDIRELTNVLVARARFRWVLRWDADFVGYTEGPRSLARLRGWLEGLDPRRHVLVYLRMVEVCGDLLHQRRATATRSDGHAFTASAALRYVYGHGGWEAPRVPRWYRVRRFETPTFVHVDVKPAPRMLDSWLWKQYLTDPARDRWPGFDAYRQAVLAQRWPGLDRQTAARRWLATTFADLVPYDRARFGELPAPLQAELAAPRFRLVYRDGRIVDRVEP